MEAVIEQMRLEMQAMSQQMAGLAQQVEQEKARADIMQDLALAIKNQSKKQSLLDTRGLGKPSCFGNDSPQNLETSFRGLRM